MARYDQLSCSPWEGQAERALAGFDVPDIDRDYITKRLQNDYSCIPVYLSAEVAERYYNGFSNSILWPLFHCEFALGVLWDWKRANQCSRSPGRDVV